MEMFYPPAHYRILRERVVFLATCRYGLREDLAKTLVNGYVREDGSFAAEDALAAIRRRSAATPTALRRSANSPLSTDQGLTVLRQILDAIPVSRRPAPASSATGKPGSRRAS